jgi:hypothetical protein
VAALGEQSGGLWEQGTNLERAGQQPASGSRAAAGLEASRAAVDLGEQGGGQPREQGGGGLGEQGGGGLREQGGGGRPRGAGQRWSRGCRCGAPQDKKWMTCGIRVDNAYPFFTAGCSIRSKRT